MHLGCNKILGKPKTYYKCPNCGKELSFEEFDNLKCEKCGKIDQVIEVVESE
jgi:Zn finger protein HypA/HybF involved in hydrogenase expression